MIDRTTLPIIPAWTRIQAGTRFTIRGHNFGLWPDFIAMGYSSSGVISGTIPGADAIGLISRTETELVFEMGVTHSYPTVTEWTFFAAGKNAPRTLLEYHTI